MTQSPQSPHAPSYVSMQQFEDPIYASHLYEGLRAARSLAADSDIVTVEAEDPSCITVHFDCLTLVRGPDGSVREHRGCTLRLWRGPAYLRTVDSLRVFELLEPREILHPNARFPLLCIGPVTPGTPVPELLYRAYEVLTFQNLLPDERDALDAAACQYARHHADRFPLERRPLKRLSANDAPHAPHAPLATTDAATETR